MTSHRASDEDLEFVRAFETAEIAAEDFDHRAHLRLAYVCLCGQGVDDAHDRIRKALQRYLARIGAPPCKYHETMTRAWILAVPHFMDQAAPCSSADDLVDRHPELLDGRIMLTHYSAGLLFSDEARREFVEPDIQAIPPR